MFLFVSGCSKRSDKSQKQQNLPGRYAIIGDTIFPMLPSYEIRKTKENRTVKIKLEKDLVEGEVTFIYDCFGPASEKALDLKDAEQRIEEGRKKINESGDATLTDIVKEYRQFKGNKSFFIKSQLRYRDEKDIDTEHQSETFNYEGKQYHLYMFIFKPTKVTRAYSDHVWKKLTNEISLLQRDKGKIECSINKINIDDSKVSVELTVINKSDTTVKVSVPTIEFALPDIRVDGRRLFYLTEDRDRNILEIFPYSSKEYMTLKAKESRTSGSSRLDTKYINEELIELLRKSSKPIKLNYEYKGDVVFTQDTSKELFVQTVASKGVANMTYSGS